MKPRTEVAAINAAVGRCGRRLLPLLIGMTVFNCCFADDLYSNFQKCTQERDNAKRLACFDREAATPPIKHAVEPPQRQQSTESFGLSKSAQDSAAKPAKLTDRVAAISVRRNSRIIVTLENGQVWTQQDDAEFPVSVGDSVTIYARALGSFWLSFTSGSNRTIRVKRLKAG